MAKKKKKRIKNAAPSSKKRKIHWGRLAVLLLPIVLLIGGIYGLYRYFNPLLLKSDYYIAQYGKEFSPTDNIKSLFMDSEENVTFTGEVDTSTIKDYNVSYTYKGKTYPFTVSVQDTEAPVISLISYTTDTVETVKAESFIESITDSSLYTYKMDNREDTKESGKYTITITAKDKYGNESSAQTKLIRKEDKTAPVLEGFESKIEILQGEDYSSSLYEVTDNLDSNPTVYCDTSKLNNTLPGTYEVTYTVRDRSNNEKQYVQEVTVVEDPDYGKPVVYLTFDDGPSANTLKILDILDQYDAQATFFVTGRNPKFFDNMKEAYDRGHTIGLHTYTHDYAQVYASDEAYFDDLQKISDVVEEVTGTKADCIRFPGGSSNMVSAEYSEGIMTRLVQEVQEQGYQYFDWNGDSTDASGNNVPVSTLVSNATAPIGQEKINILFHDTDAKDTTVQALPEIIETYQKAGYIFRGVSSTSFAPHHEVNN